MTTACWRRSILPTRLPFAGLCESGLGVGGIPYTFHDMQIEKMLVVKPGALSSARCR